MGANAQTTVPTFTAGQVLTAAQMNDSARTGVPVFADTTARDAAFGGSGEKTLAEGQLCYLENTNVVQYYDGSTWATVGPSTPGLVLVKSQTIGSAVSSVTVSDAFSSTYDNYRITVYGGAGSGGLNIGLTLGSTATGYYRWGTYSLYSATTVLGLSGNNAASWSDVVAASTNSIHGQIELFGPNVAKNTYMNAIAPQSVTSSGPVLQAGFLNDSTQYTAFTLTVITPGGTMTGGTIRVYGYSN